MTTPSTLRIGRRYRAARLQGPYDAIVVGSGIGGLTTAACLSRQGMKVLVLEQHYTAGGFTHAYNRNGYEWDVGVHYLGEMGNRRSQIRQMFDFISNGQLQWAEMDKNYDRFFIGAEQFDAVAGKREYAARLKARFPDEHDAIDEYLRRLDTMQRAVPALAVEKLLPGMAGRLATWGRKALLPDYVNRTTYDVLRDLTDNELLIAVLTGQWGDNGVPPQRSSFLIHCLIARHYLGGAYYPVGGASRIAETIIPVIQQSGGEVFTYANVEEIMIERGRAVAVRMHDGQAIRAPIIISDAGVFNTFERLLPREISRRSGYEQRLRQVSPSIAHLGVYIGLKASAEHLGLPKTNFWIYPNTSPVQNLETFRRDLSAEFPAVYISFPSAKDPSWESRYPGTATIEIVAPAFFAHFEHWQNQPWGKRGDDYDALKQQLTERLLAHLYDKLPQLRGKIDYCELSTPLSTDYFCAYGRGEMYGLEHDPQRFEQRWLRPKTRIPGLYLTGQDVLSCGVGGAMSAGFISALAVLGPRRGWRLLRQFGRSKSDTSRGH